MSKIFASVMLVIGIVVFYLGWSIDENVRLYQENYCSACQSRSLRVCSRLLLILSTIIIMFSLSYMLNKDCNSWLFKYYTFTVLILGAIILGLGIAISVEIKKTNCNINGFDAWVITLGSFLIVVPLGFEIYKWFKNAKKDEPLVLTPENTLVSTPVSQTNSESSTPTSISTSGSSVSSTPISIRGNPPPVPARDWQKYLDDSSKQYYYHNSKTGETTWENPWKKP
jgi:hypothetical protein